MGSRNLFGDYETGTFYPYLCDIESITSDGPNSIIETDIDHMFVVGNQVQFQIPKQYGMTQLNGLKGYVINVPSADEITINVDTSYFDSFSIPSVDPDVVLDPAQVLPCGDQNSGGSSVGKVPPNPNIVPGSYFVTQL